MLRPYEFPGSAILHQLKLKTTVKNCIQIERLRPCAAQHPWLLCGQGVERQAVVESMTEIERELSRDSSQDSVLRFFQPLVDAEALVQARLGQGDWSEAQQAQARDLVAMLAQSQKVLCDLWRQYGGALDGA